MTRVAFITGVTGFIGGELARHLYESKSYSKIYLLIRPQAKYSASQRFLQILERWSAVHKKSYDSEVFIPVSGELSGFGSFTLPEETTHIFHVAASTRFDDSLSYAREVNLYATQNLLLLCRSLKKLELFIHFSTAFACGDKLGEVLESQKSNVFFNAYEKSKYESEKAVEHAGIPYVIVRPSIVVGDSVTGYTQHYRVFYSMLRVWMHGKIPRAPLHGKVCVDIVPVDFVCKGTIALVENPESFCDTYHLCAGKNGLVDPLSVFDYAIRVFNLPKPPISPVWVVYILNSRFVRPLLNNALRDYLAAMQGHFPYMMPRNRYYDMSKSQKILEKVGVECPRLDVYGERMFLFCKESNWGRNLKGLTYV